MTDKPLMWAALWGKPRTKGYQKVWRPLGVFFDTLSERDTKGRVTNQSAKIDSRNARK
jgi:hypothetical protein